MVWFFYTNLIPGHYSVTAESFTQYIKESQCCESKGFTETGLKKSLNLKQLDKCNWILKVVLNRIDGIEGTKLTTLLSSYSTSWLIWLFNKQHGHILPWYNSYFFW